MSPSSMPTRMTGPCSASSARAGEWVSATRTTAIKGVERSAIRDMARCSLCGGHRHSEPLIAAPCYHDSSRKRNRGHERGPPASIGQRGLGPRPTREPTHLESLIFHQCADRRHQEIAQEFNHEIQGSLVALQLALTKECLPLALLILV